MTEPLSVASTSMDVQETAGNPPTRKRKSNTLVDPDTKEELADPKKPKIDLDEGKKLMVLKFICLSTYKMFLALASTATTFGRNINVGSQILNIVFTCHNILRQRKAGTTGNMDKKSDAKDFTVTHLGVNYSVTKEEALKVVEAAAKTVGLVYKKYDTKDKENWFGVVGPYLNFFAGFQLRSVELRVGHSNMPFKKIQGVSQSYPVFKYGINGGHHILLEGCTYPPEKRSSMAQSLGPLTVLLCYIQADKMYEEKWKRAAKRAMSHIPMIDDILSVVKGKKSFEISGIIKALADMLMITTSRQSHRAFFPIIPFIAVTTNIDCTTKLMTFKEDLLKKFNASGHGAFLIYKLMCESGMYYMSGSMSQNQAAQITYHSIFGTFKEDLGVLAQITNQGNWQTREEMGKCFLNASTCKKEVGFEFIRQEYYSKLSSANLSGLLASSYLQTTSSPVFSGFRTHTFSDEFFESISKRIGDASSGKTIESLHASTTSLLNDLQKEVDKRGKTIDMGTVSWRKTDGLSITELGEEVNLVVNTRGLHFLGKKKDSA